MDSADITTELHEELDKFLSDGRLNGRSWECLVSSYDLLRRSLRLVVVEADSPDQTRVMELFMQLMKSWRLLTRRQEEFGHSVAAHYAHPGETPVNAVRLARNFRALFATAMAAAAARQAARDPDDEDRKEVVRTWAARAAELLRDRTDETPPHPDLDFPRGTPAWFVNEAFYAARAGAVPSVTAWYWTLYWLDEHTRLTQRNLSLPVAATDGRAGGGLIGDLSLYRLNLRPSAETLFEHPDMALLPLGDELLQGVERAWRTAPRQMVCWRLKALPIPQDGDSLSGAAAVGFNFLARAGEEYKHGCLIIAQLGDDGQTLYAAGHEREKIYKAKAVRGTRQVILGSEEGWGGASRLTAEDFITLHHEGVSVRRVASLSEALVAASYESEAGLSRPVDKKILGRYTRHHALRPQRDRQPLDPASRRRGDLARTWIGEDGNSKPFLIRLRPFGETPEIEDFERALWDKELRILYRVCSSPGAGELILKLHDVGIDHQIRQFVIVLEGEGYTPLDTALAQRPDRTELMSSSLREKAGRRHLWRGLQRVALGVRLLHEQQVVHGAISAENIFINDTGNTEMWRLGGFEWSMLLGRMHSGVKGDDWSTPPECAGEEGEGYSFDTDWYAFGILLARCFYNLESLADHPPEALNRYVVDMIARDPDPLHALEQELILGLIARNQRDRMRDSHKILGKIENILRYLEAQELREDSDAPLVVVFDKYATSRGCEYARELTRTTGFTPSPEHPEQQYSPFNPAHVTNLKAALFDEFRDALLYPERYSNSYLLVGKHLRVYVGPYKRTPSSPATWEVAEGLPPRQTFRSEHRPSDLAGRTVRFITEEEYREETNLRRQNWERYLPSKAGVGVRENLEKFREFLRCTNQLELLMRYAEIFPYRVVNRYEHAGREYIEVVEREGARNVPEFCRSQNMFEFLRREQESKPASHLQILLTGDDRLRAVSGGALEEWSLVEIQRPAPERNEPGQLKLARQRHAKAPPAPPEGYLRSADHIGQIKLIERRKNAIDRLRDHSYLLSSLVQPGEVKIDTGQDVLPYPIPEGALDAHKERVLKNIMRVRPLYALQGPPGTGKTTLVAYLLREILTEDRVAQILVTAQAHGAVDVLRDRVKATFMKGGATGQDGEAQQGELQGDDALDDNLPLAIRLGLNRRTQPDGDEPTTATVATSTGAENVEQVSIRLLERMHERLVRERGSLSPLQQKWLALIEGMRAGTQVEALKDFQQLVRRGANIVYCTTSARDLEELIEGSQDFDWRGGQSFDWTIVEEAGKVHGFDLALPLQAGHRWLLLGDQKQLPPYRFKDFKDGIGHLDEAFEFLKRLRREKGLVDDQWITAWEERGQNGEGEPGEETSEQKEFKKYADMWLRTFGHVYDQLRDAVSGQHRGRVTDFNYAGSAAGKLLRQYRMHPVIGKMIANTFYSDEGMEDDTEKDGRPVPSVCHPFTTPEGIRDKAIVWIDMPWGNPTSRSKTQYLETGGGDGKPGHTNPEEVRAVKFFLKSLRCDVEPAKKLKVAVLSPYSRQVEALKRALDERALPPWLEFSENLSSRQPGSVAPRRKKAYTVDSFQGNQADMVIISMVRNNRRQGPKGLGFLKESERMNVLMSRAEKLLVLVGSWRFFEEQLKDIGVPDDKDDPFWHWLTLLKHLRNGMQRGDVLKLDYPSCFE